MIRDKFIEICKSAIEADQANNHENCRVLEPYFQQIISLAKNEEEKEELKQCLVSVLRKQIDAPYEMMPYLMRALKFQEIIQESKRIYGSSEDPRKIGFHEEIVEAVESEHWKDSDLWTQMK